MNNLQKYLSTCLLGIAALLFGASPAWAQVTLGTASNFAVLSGGAVTCTTSTVEGDVGAGGAVSLTSCAINGNLVLSGALTNVTSTISGTTTTPLSAQVLTDFNGAYTALAATACGTVLTTLDINQTLSPGVYCFDAAATATSKVLTLNGPANGIWIFKIGTLGTGALTGTSFSVVMTGGGQPCNVFWWVAEGVTMTTSAFKGTILAGGATGAITLTGGTLVGRAFAKTAVTMTNASVVGCGALAALAGAAVCKDRDGDDEDENDHDRDHDKDHHDRDHDNDQRDR